MNKRLGIVGGGQLGLMLSKAAKGLGFTVTVLDPTPQSPASQVANAQIVASFDDHNALKELANQSDFLTFEIELADANLLADLSAKGTVINPSANTLALIKDKLSQKQFLSKNGLPVAPFFAINKPSDIQTAATKYGYPLMLKARTGGYDGRGNALIKSAQEIPSALKKLGQQSLYGEAFVSFKKEIAVIVARNPQGEIAVYPVVETRHRNNICHLVIAPAQISAKLQKEAQTIATKVMNLLQGAGVFAIELFLTTDNQILINEIAPRVHNSGHFSIEACQTSQFEQHVRAVTGMSLASTAMKSKVAVMINILADRVGPANPQGVEAAHALPDVSVHLYGKAESRPERKMGHITVLHQNPSQALTIAKKARKLITI